MSLTIKPFEQLGAEAITGLIITGGQNGNATKIVRRANTALAVAIAFADLANGNAASGIAAAQAAIANTNLDPGVALAVNGLFTIGAQQLALVGSFGNLIPVMGATAEAVASNIAAGITAAANAEIAKYGTQAPAPIATSSSVPT